MVTRETKLTDLMVMVTRVCQQKLIFSFATEFPDSLSLHSLIQRSRRILWSVYYKMHCFHILDKFRISHVIPVCI
ncbi:unnamed protein product [Calicophoron daubneyi]|uniref:Uncharacterized protein n=1 Tax=Calicophoron daubneyi TaxID=300641 RepID=A0AAV2SZX0_CALDB